MNKKLKDIILFLFIQIILGAFIRITLDVNPNKISLYGDVTFGEFVYRSFDYIRFAINCFLVARWFDLVDISE